MGRDKQIAQNLKDSGTFQSTRPHGARHGHFKTGSIQSHCFNPRARMGRDKNIMKF